MQDNRRVSSQSTTPPERESCAAAAKIQNPGKFSLKKIIRSSASSKIDLMNHLRSEFRFRLLGDNPLLSLRFQSGLDSGTLKIIELLLEVIKSNSSLRSRA